jgi:16S rRNA (guanine527-N7)-methyltransferase
MRGGWVRAASATAVGLGLVALIALDEPASSRRRRDAVVEAPARRGFTFYGPGVSPPAVDVRLAALSARFALPGRAVERLGLLLELVAAEPASITAVRDPVEGVDVHVADSLVALDLEVVREAERIADVGSGAGFPGLVLAIALPQARVVLVESVRRKAAFLERAVVALGLANVAVVSARVESWAAGLAGHDLVAARAVAPLGVLVEYAAPLLRKGGTLVAWKGRLDVTEAEDAVAAADALGMSSPRGVAVEPFAGSLDRHLYLSSKVGPTPPGYPRRPGMARKHPFRVSS